MEELLEGLNPKQREIVKDTEGQFLVLAGSGSGKTRVLTYRIAYLLKNGVKPWRILAVTFTNKAAKEMKERLVDLVGPEGRDVWIGTFHGICFRMLARFGSEIGLENLTIIDKKEQTSLMKKVIEAFGADYDPRVVGSIISNAKNKLLSPTDLALEASTKQEREVANIYQAYEDSKADADYVDFDDLIMETVHLLNVSQKVRETYQEQFKYILTDECQDQNKGQFQLLDILSAAHGNIFMVGDADQAIYGFRGAEIRNIINFQEYYPNCVIHRLEQNYRSTDTIVEASNQLIKNNEERLDKTAFTDKTDGDPIVIRAAEEDSREADFIRDVIQRTIQVEGRDYSDFAVLYRTNRQSRAIEASFMQAGIPYQVIGSTNFYDRKEIKDITAYLRIINNEFDELAIERVINVPKRGIGETTIKRIADYALEYNIPFPKAIEHVEDIPKIAKGTKTKILTFLELIKNLRDFANQPETTTTELINKILIDTGYKASYETGKEEDETRLENIDELLNVASIWDESNDGNKDLSDFLAETTLVTEADMIDSGNFVTLMTTHASKGLEYKIVFIAGMEESIFPHGRSLMNPKELEEERRLFYVAMTRAEEKLYISYCKQRYEHARGSLIRNKKSRFLDELPSHLVKEI